MIKMFGPFLISGQDEECHGRCAAADENAEECRLQDEMALKKYSEVIGLDQGDARVLDVLDALDGTKLLLERFHDVVGIIHYAYDFQRL